MSTSFATTYCSNELNAVIGKEVQCLNELHMADPDFWSSQAILNTVREYLHTHSHPQSKRMINDIHNADICGDDDEVCRYADNVTEMMMRDDDSKRFLMAQYAKVLKNNPTIIENLMKDEKGVGTFSLLKDGFFDMCLFTEDARPTEFVEVISDKKGNYSVTYFLANTVDKFLEIANVEKGDVFSLGRVNMNSLYLLLTVSKADGTEEIHPFIPVKWVRKASATDFFVKALIPSDVVNEFYRSDLQE